MGVFRFQRKEVRLLKLRRTLIFVLAARTLCAHATPTPSPSAAPDFDAALTALVPKGTPSPACLQISRGPKSGFETSSPATDTLIKKVMTAIGKERLQDLYDDFHPRLRTTLEQLTIAMTALRRTLGTPLNPAVFRTWLLYSADGNPEDHSCDNGEFVVNSHFGYKSQIGLWLQVMGKGELGRLYISLVPKDNRLFIGAWHLHQWSHTGVDSLGWQEKASVFSQEEQKPSAYLLQDIAFKLIDTKKFVIPQATNPVKAARDRIMSSEAWEKTVNATIALKTSPLPASTEITAIRTALAQDGAGINLYLRVPNELVPNELFSHCNALASRLFNAPAFKGVDGTMCYFLLPGESSDREGRLGGQYIKRKNPR